MTFELSISPKYVKKWGLWEAVRELLQNHIDQETRDPQANKYSTYNKDTFTIGNKKVILSTRTLLMGETDKESTDLIGQFGEGYKLAMLVLTRLGKQVAIKTGAQVWTCRFQYSEAYQSDVLVVDVKESDTILSGTEWTIRPLSKEELDAITTRYLPDMMTSQLLPEEEAGKIFVGGLYVCTLTGFRHAYNFAPSAMRLDRDRNMVAEFDVSYYASRLWANSSEGALELYQGLVSDAPDTKYVDYHDIPTTLRDQLLNHYIATHGEAVPVSNQEEIAELGGRRFQLVPERLKKILRAMKSWVTPKKTPAERLKIVLEKHGAKMPKYLREELADILKDLSPKD